MQSVISRIFVNFYRHLKKRTGWRAGCRKGAWGQDIQFVYKTDRFFWHQRLLKSRANEKTEDYKNLG